MAIVAFAIIPMMGLLPIGMSTSRQAIDTTIEAQIIEQMKSQVQQTAFSDLGTMTGTMTYFDDKGQVFPSISLAPGHRGAWQPPPNHRP